MVAEILPTMGQPVVMILPQQHEREAGLKRDGLDPPRKVTVRSGGVHAHIILMALPTVKGQGAAGLPGWRRLAGGTGVGSDQAGGDWVETVPVPGVTVPER